MLVQVGLEYRYMPPVAKLIEIVKEGKVGQIKMVAIREHRFPFLVKVTYAISFPFVISHYESYFVDSCLLYLGAQLEQVQL